MKKLIILSIILLATQISQAQIHMNNQARKMPHQNEMMKGSCGTVTGIFTDEVDSHSATIHWTGNGAVQYIVQYVNVNDRQDKGIRITPLTSVALDNLVPCGTYQFVIIAKCNDGNYRSRPQVFFTLGCK